VEHQVNVLRMFKSRLHESFRLSPGTVVSFSQQSAGR
jgi:hypothetical protein